MSNGDIIFITAALYIIGFVLSIYMLSIYGKDMGMDYDNEKSYVDFDDWNSNAEAFTAFSLGWPLFWFVCLIYFSLKGLVNCVSKYQKSINKK